MLTQKLKKINMKSRGLGDSIEKFTKATGKVTNGDCGCNKRRDTLNRLFPYDRN